MTGREAIVRQFERITADWAEHHFEDIELAADSGDWVVFTYRWCARGRTSGIDTHFDLAVASCVQDGGIIEAHFRWNSEEALEPPASRSRRPFSKNILPAYVMPSPLAACRRFADGSA